MKRSYLKRSKPLARSGRLKPRSAKRAATDRAAGPWRAALKSEIGMCELCGDRWLAGLACHELSRGPARVKALTERGLILVLCNLCHGFMSDYELWPLARQLALVYVRRREDFDLALFNSVRGRAAGAITQEEVDVYLPEIRERLTNKGA